MQDCQVPDNTEELERMMDDYGPRLLRLCFLRLQDVQLAEDALQDTFVQAWQAMIAAKSPGFQPSLSTAAAPSKGRPGTAWWT